MKKLFLTNWVTYFYVAVMFFSNLNPAFAGDDVPKFRAKEVPRAKPVLFPKLRMKIEEAKQARRELKTPHIDDESKNPVCLNVRQSPGVCHPKRRPPTPLLTAEVPPPTPLLTAEVPPVPTQELLVAEVPPAPTQEYLVAEVPEAYQQELLVAEVPSGVGELLFAEVPPPLPPIINYIQLPCPPQPVCIEDDSYHSEEIVERNVRRRNVELVDDRRVYVDQGPVYVDRPVMHQQQPYFEPPCHNGGHPGFAGQPTHYQEPVCHQNYPGGHPGMIQGGQQGGGNYERAMAWGHHVVDSAYGIGYGIGTRAYDVGRNW